MPDRYLYGTCGHSFNGGPVGPWPAETVCPEHGRTVLWVESDHPEEGAVVLPLHAAQEGEARDG